MSQTRKPSKNSSGKDDKNKDQRYRSVWSSVDSLDTQTEILNTVTDRDNTDTTTITDETDPTLVHVLVPVPTRRPTMGVTPEVLPDYVDEDETPTDTDETGPSRLFDGEAQQQ
jgi:hypothetical protein